MPALSAQADVPAQLAQLSASDGATRAGFGLAVALDGATAVAGSPMSNEAFQKSGSAYVFTATANSWSQQAKLAPSDAGPSDLFGIAVAIDGNTIAVGAGYDDGAFIDTGSVYVFTRSGSTWTQQAKLTASDASDRDLFGSSVALDGDTLAVGATYDDSGALSDTGSVYIFSRSGTTWTQQAKLTAPDAAANDLFGASISIDGDDIAIGAPYRDAGTSDAGAVYLFSRTSGDWNQRAALTASDGTSGDLLGYSVSLDAGTVVGGAPYDDFAANSSGSAYVFARIGATWAQQAKLTAADAGNDDLFGSSVSVNGDDVVVGAPLDDDGGSDSGSAYAHTRQGTTWVQTIKLAAASPKPSDYFGGAVSSSADASVVGATGRDGSSPDFGAVFVFVPSSLVPPTTTTTSTTTTTTTPATSTTSTTSPPTSTTTTVAPCAPPGCGTVPPSSSTTTTTTTTVVPTSTTVAPTTSIVASANPPGPGPSPRSGILPSTGAAVLRMLNPGGLLIIAGAVALLLSRRRSVRPGPNI
jgi:hypothetical protein